MHGILFEFTRSSISARFPTVAETSIISDILHRGLWSTAALDVGGSCTPRDHVSSQRKSDHWPRPCSSYLLSYTGRNLKQDVFTFCWCSCRLVWLTMSDKVTTGRTMTDFWVGGYIASATLRPNSRERFFCSWCKTGRTNVHPTHKRQDFVDVQVKICGSLS